LVRLGSGMVYNCSAALLEATLRTIASSGELKENRMSNVLMQGKTSVEEAASVIDELYGIRFEVETFHFALAATLMKGLQTPATKPVAIKTLTALVEIFTANVPESTRWNVDVQIPPYFPMVVARAASVSEIKELLWMVGLSAVDDSEMDIWSSIPPFEKMSERSLLLCGLLAIIDFKTCEEVIQRQALAFFTHMANRRAEVLLLLYDHLIEHLDNVLNTSHNPGLLKEANSLMCAVSKNPRFTSRKGRKEGLNRFLDDSGLCGVWESGFLDTHDREKRCAVLTDKLIEFIIM